jgi:hypothetical protein
MTTAARRGGSSRSSTGAVDCCAANNTSGKDAGCGIQGAGYILETDYRSELIYCALTNALPFPPHPASSNTHHRNSNRGCCG